MGLKSITFLLHGVQTVKAGPVLLNVYHNEYHYIWFRAGDLNGFPDIKPFMK